MRETGESYKTAQRSLVEERAKEIGGVVEGQADVMRDE